MSDNGSDRPLRLEGGTFNRPVLTGLTSPELVISTRFPVMSPLPRRIPLWHQRNSAWLRRFPSRGARAHSPLFPPRFASLCRY